MSDFDRDELLLTDAFEEFTTGSTPKINAEGTASVRKRVARRRRNRVVLLVLLTVLAVGVPVGVYATSGPERPTGPRQPTAGSSPSTSSTAAASPTVTASPADPAVPEPSGISRDLLQLSTITIPDWKLDGTPASGCLSGPTKLSAPLKDGSTGVQLIGDVVDANLDSDPALEAAVILECNLPGDPQRQVVAFERDGAGRIVTMGQVLREYSASLVRRTSAGGGITVDVQSAVACCGVSPEMVMHQQRGYAWNGIQYVQIDGPTSFGAHPRVTDLKVTATGLSFGAVTGGTRSGTMKITVTNLGGVASNRFVLKVAANVQARVTACAGSVCHQPKDGGFPIIGGLAPGRKVTYTVTVVVFADTVIALVTFPVSVTAIGSKDTGTMADTNPSNNVTGTLVIAGS